MPTILDTLGVQMCTISYGKEASFAGKLANVTITVTPMAAGIGPIRLNWAATGDIFSPFSDTTSGDTGAPGIIALPRTDQDGFRHGSSPFKNWYYKAAVVAELADGQQLTRTYQFQTTSSTLDLDLLDEDSVVTALPVIVGAGTEPAGLSDATRAVLATTYPTLDRIKQGAPWWAKVTQVLGTADMPTINVDATSAIAGSNLITPTTDLVNDAHFRIDNTLTVTAPQAGVINAGAVPHTLVPEFVTDDSNSVLEYNFRAIGDPTPFAIRVEVDGIPHSLPMQTFTGLTASGLYMAHITFPTARSRRVKVWALGCDWFAGVKVAAGQTVTRPAREVQRRLCLIGDSYLAGGPGLYPLNGNRFETSPYWLYRLLECDSLIHLGISGTGWVNDNGAGQQYSTRIPMAIAAKPHILILKGSRNDIAAGIDQSQVAPAVTAALQLVADLPLVITTGPETPGSTLATVVAGIKAASQRAGRKFLDLQGLETETNSGHPTYANDLTIAQGIYALLDRPHIDATVAGIIAGRTPTALTLTASPGGAASVGATVTLTGTLAATQPGTVTFYANGTAIGTATISGGAASITSWVPTAGSYTLSARFQPTDTLSIKPSTSNLISYNVSANLGHTQSFDQADGVLGNTANGKVRSTVGTGSWVAASNLAANTTATGNSFSVVDEGTPNGTYQVTLKGTVTAGMGVAACRFVDGSNHLYINANGTGGRPKLWKRVANASTALTDGTGGTVIAANDVIALVLNADNSMSLKQNGTVIATVSAANGTTGTSIDTATKSGLFVSTTGTAGERWDDESFVAA